MRLENQNIQIISAPSILGLQPTGVEELADSLLGSGLAERLGTKNKVIALETLNHKYNYQRDKATNVLNPDGIRDFSLTLAEVVRETVFKKQFPFVLGGDCSVIIGTMAGIKARQENGLIFMDAHADFYQPDKSPTGEVADMDLAIVTGRGPELLTNINNLRPYVTDENVIHIGQRDWYETRQYGSQDIRETSIKCFSLAEIEREGMDATAEEVLKWVKKSKVEKFWIHYDTDVLSDEINPAVDYRLPGGLQFEQVELLLKQLLGSDTIVGISVAIFNPQLDAGRRISKNITESLVRAFS
ncbi:MAG TPA: arginase family protein [Chryseolinea sp.]|nr:arginase family protein [Chryseolinea sp.]